MAHGNKEMPLDTYPFMDNDLKTREGGVTPEEFNALKDMVLQNTSDISDLSGQVSTTTITSYKNDDILNIITPKQDENNLKINKIDIIENLNTRQLNFDIEFVNYNYFIDSWNNSGKLKGIILGTVTEQFRPNKLIFGGNGHIIGQISSSGSAYLHIPILPTEPLASETVSFTYIKKRV